jgi:hypothetical protein
MNDGCTEITPWQYEIVLFSEESPSLKQPGYITTSRINLVFVSEIFAFGVNLVCLFCSTMYVDEIR